MPTRDRFLPGHSMGRAIVVMLQDCPDCQNPAPRRYYKAVAGHGACSCGLLSEHLDTGMARRAWHSQHKDQMKALLALAYLEGEPG